jgi:uncharacterized protein
VPAWNRHNGSVAYRKPTRMPPSILPIVLLSISNVFMTLAWYGHLKYKATPLIVVILVSWAIAFVEYCFAVPANRYGHAVYSAAELKTIQEIITLTVFAGFSVWVLKEPLGWNHLIGFGLIAAGAAFIFRG